MYNMNYTSYIWWSEKIDFQIKNFQQVLFVFYHIYYYTYNKIKLIKIDKLKPDKINNKKYLYARIISVEKYNTAWLNENKKIMFDYWTI